MSNKFDIYTICIWGFETDLPKEQKKAPSINEAFGIKENEGVEEKISFDDIIRFISYRSKAILGDADAHFAMGVLYLLGKGVRQDFSKAYTHFEKAERKGHAKAAYNMSRFWQFGLLGEADSDSTIIYLNRAAELGYPEGFLRTADDCEKGGVFAGIFNDGATSNHILNNMWKPLEDCIKLYDKAVELYCRGFLQGAKGDIFRVLNYLNKDNYLSMASNEAMQWIIKLGEAYCNGNKYIKKDPKRGFQLFSHIAPYSKAAKIELAACYFNGWGVDKDVAKCYQIITELTSDNKLDKKKREAYYILGICYYLGEGVPVDMSKARYWLELAAKYNYEDAYGILGSLYFQGLGAETDYKKAHHYIKLSADSKIDQNAGNSMGMLAQMYFFGGGCETNYSQAFYYAQKAATNNVFQGFRILAWCYSGGKGTKRNYKAALENCKKALAMQPDDGLQQLLELLSSNGQTLRPTADLKKTFNEATGNAMGDIIGNIFETLLGAGSDD